MSPPRARRAPAWLLVVATVAAQQRCRPDKIIKPDGSFNFGACIEATLYGRQIGDEGIIRPYSGLQMAGLPSPD